MYIFLFKKHIYIYICQYIFSLWDQNIRNLLEQFIINFYYLRRMLHDVIVSAPANTNKNYRR